MMLDEAFYDDQAMTAANSHAGNEMANFHKRPMTLDLNSGKKIKFGAPPQLLTTPDIEKLKFTLPELERFYLNNQAILGHAGTPTPSISIPKPITDEQDLYAAPFFEALSSLHNNDSNSASRVEIGPLTNNSSNSSEYQSEPKYSVLMPSSDFSNIIPQHVKHVIKEEPQTVPSVPPSSSPSSMSPINMESQEKQKLERKRQRNRVAASKCRRRKLERIAKLEDKVKLLKSENSDLTQSMSKLMVQISQLKQTVVEHVHNGCEFTTNIL